MSDKKEVTETAKEFQEEEKGGADSSKQFSEAAHDQRDDSGAREDGGKAETDKPVTKEFDNIGETIIVNV